MVAFVQNASPFVTVAQAKQSSDDQLQLYGAIVKDSIKNDFKHHVLTFMLRDEKGDTLPVRYTGEIPSELDQIPKVVAVGGMSGSEFRSSKLLVKCPSKYEADKPKKVARNDTR